MTHFFTPSDDPSLERLDPLSNEVFSALRRGSSLRHRLMMALMPPEQTHPAQAGYLLVIEQNDGISQADVAARLRVSRPTVTAMLQKIEALGLIERRVDEHDQRITRIFLTSSGQETAARMRDAHIQAIEATIGRLPENDRRELVRLLHELNSVTEAALAERGVRA